MINNRNFSNYNKIEKDSNQNENLFNKIITCPVCTNKFETKVLKAKKALGSVKDSDFFVRYKVVNPYFYEIWLCPNCGYATFKNDFEKIKEIQIERIKFSLSPKWTPRNYPEEYNPLVAIDRFKVALLNAMILNSKESTKGMLSLKIAWMYRLLDDNVNEIIYLKKAFTGLSEAYYNEKLPVYGLDQFTLLYLLGELKRRTNEDDEALKFFSELFISRTAPQKIKELARDAKDKIKEKQ
ncbi:MAG: DUF2225 domain-containing protein [Sarcina sp.]